MKTIRIASVVSLVSLLAAAASAQAADVNNGQRLYRLHCASCHGPNGVSVMPGAPHIARGTTLMKADTMLLASIRSGRSAMPAYAGMLKDREILDVIAYMRTLK